LIGSVKFDSLPACPSKHESRAEKQQYFFDLIIEDQLKILITARRYTDFLKKIR